MKTLLATVLTASFLTAAAAADLPDEDISHVMGAWGVAGAYTIALIDAPCHQDGRPGWGRARFDYPITGKTRDACWQSPEKFKARTVEVCMLTDGRIDGELCTVLKTAEITKNPAFRR